MAKSTKHGGDSYTPEELADPNPPVRIQRAELGKVDQPSVGTDSSPSSESDSKPSDRTSHSHRKPVPMTENLSGAQESGTDSGAHSTDGSIRKTSPGPSARKATPKGKANIRSTDPETDFEDFE